MELEVSYRRVDQGIEVAAPLQRRLRHQVEPLTGGTAAAYLTLSRHGQAYTGVLTVASAVGDEVTARVVEEEVSECLDRLVDRITMKLERSRRGRTAPVKRISRYVPWTEAPRTPRGTGTDTPVQ